MFSSGLYPIEFLFYFKEAFDTKRLRSALKKLSSAFWPVFGEYENGRIVYDKYREENFYAEEAVDRELDDSEIEKLDFGNGPPDLVIPLTAEKNSAAILAKNENFILRCAY